MAAARRSAGVRSFSLNWAALASVHLPSISCWDVPSRARTRLCRIFDVFDTFFAAAEPPAPADAAGRLSRSSSSFSMALRWGGGAPLPRPALAALAASMASKMRAGPSFSSACARR